MKRMTSSPRPDDFSRVNSSVVNAASAAPEETRAMVPIKKKNFVFIPEITVKFLIQTVSRSFNYVGESKRGHARQVTVSVVQATIGGDGLIMPQVRVGRPRTPTGHEFAARFRTSRPHLIVRPMNAG